MICSAWQYQMYGYKPKMSQKIEVKYKNAYRFILYLDATLPHGHWYHRQTKAPLLDLNQAVIAAINGNLALASDLDHENPLEPKRVYINKAPFYVVKGHVSPGLMAGALQHFGLIGSSLIDESLIRHQYARTSATNENHPLKTLYIVDQPHGNAYFITSYPAIGGQS